MQNPSKILIVGINPSNYITRKTPRKNHTFDRLYRWCDYLEIEHFSFINCIFDRGKYSLKLVEYEILMGIVHQYDKVLALGGFVSKVLNKLDVGFFQLPHPSPLNRQLNSKQFEINCLNDCRKYLI